jgi:CHAT domain-containing protein/tetratricopeptide (TPR) repeat protein
MNTDPHARYVRPLADAGDWSALVRYWIAHQHPPALDKAISVVWQRGVTGRREWHKLGEFLEDLRKEIDNPQIRLREENLARIAPEHLAGFRIKPTLRPSIDTSPLVPELSKRERDCLAILVMSQETALIDLAGTAPPDCRVPLVLAGLRACEGILEWLVNTPSGDQTSIAFYSAMAANAHVQLGQSKEARSKAEAALRLYRGLARERPEIHRANVAQALDLLSFVCPHLSDLEAACVYGNEAVAIYRELVAESDGRWSRQLGGALVRLGHAQQTRGLPDSARSTFSEALGVFQALPGTPGTEIEMGTTRYNLGLLFHRGREWDKARDSLRRAVAHFRQLSEDQSGDLADALQALADVEADANALEEAKRMYGEALAIRRQQLKGVPDGLREVQDVEMAGLLNNRATVQQLLGEFEDAKAGCVEALESLGNARSVSSGCCNRVDEALLLNNLGMAQRELRELEDARKSFEEALRLYRAPARPEPRMYQPNVANALNNLASVLVGLGEHSTALEMCGEALKIYRTLACQQPEIYQSFVARTLMNIAQGRVAECADGQRPEPLFHRFSIRSLLKNLRSRPGARAADSSIREAVSIYRELFQRDPELYRPHLADALGTLGDTCMLLRRVEDAVARYKEAVHLFDEDARKHEHAFMVRRVRIHANLATLLRLKRGRSGGPDYEAAQPLLARAAHGIEGLRGKFHDEKQRRRVMGEWFGVFEQYVQNCLDLWEASCARGAPRLDLLKEGIWAAEAIRSRQLLDRMAAEERRPVNVPAEQLDKLHALRARLGRIRDRLERGAHAGDVGSGRRMGMRDVALAGQTEGGARPEANPTGEGAHAERVRREIEMWIREDGKLTEEIEKLVGEIGIVDRGFAAVPSAPALDYDSLRCVLPGDQPTAAVEYVLGRDKSVAFIVVSGDRGTQSQAPSGAQREIIPVRLPGLTIEVAARLAGEWLADYRRCRNMEFFQRLREWHAAMNKTLARVHEVSLKPVLNALPQGIRRLLIVPHQTLHLFPLHACLLEAGRFVADAYEVCYSPSLSLLHRCTQRERADAGGLLLVESPEDDSKNTLAGTVAECASIRRRFEQHGSVCRLGKDQATRDAFLGAALDCRALHYSGHASFGGETREGDFDPLESKLILAPVGEPLTLREVFRRLTLPRNQLSILNGCETGQLLPDRLDDYHSFTTGFLLAGARCVISTLWSIPDLSSALLMDKFHERWLERRDPPALALRTAQEWLRSLHAGPQLEKALGGLLEHLEDAAVIQQCRHEARRSVEEFGDTPFAAPVHWAAFICSGNGYVL